jgi:hypothetical protein
VSQRIAEQNEIVKRIDEGRIEVGKTSRSGLPPVPPGRAEAIFERFAVLYGEVCD